MPNLAEISTTTKALLGVGVLMFIDLLLDWQQVCVSFGGAESCGGASGWHGWGTLVGILLIGLLVWEGVTLAGMHKNLNLPVAAGMISAALTVAILVFTLIKVFLADNDFRHWPAWVGLLLAVVLVVLGWRKYVEAGGMEGMTGAPAQQPPPPPPAEPPAAPPPAPPA